MSAADRDHLKIFSGRAGRALAKAMCWCWRGMDR